MFKFNVKLLSANVQFIRISNENFCELIVLVSGNKMVRDTSARVSERERPKAKRHRCNNNENCFLVW